MQPNPKEWLEQNPGSTLNDYYKIYNVFKSGTSSDLEVSSNHDGGNKSLKWYLLAGGLLLLMILTNPSYIDHVNVAESEIRTSVQKEAGNWGVLNFLRDRGAQFLSKNFIDASERKNYLIGSIHEVYLNGEHIGSTIGVFGNVYFKPKR